MNERSFAVLLRHSLSSSIVVFVVVAVAFAITTRGRLLQSLDSTLYLSLADSAQQGKVGAFTTSTQANFTVLLLPTLLAFVRRVAPAHWEAIILAINVVCAALTAVFLMKLVRTVTVSIAAALAALLFYVGAYDVFTWVNRLLTDNIYTMLSVILFFLLVRGITDPEVRGLRRTVKMYAALIVVVITRAVGFVLVPVTIATDWVFVKHDTKANRRAVWILFGFGLLTAIVAHAYFFQDMRRWPSDFLRPKLQEYADRERGGEVVWDRPQMAHARPVSLVGHIAIEVDRFVRFFQVTTPNNSRAHNLYSIAYYGPLYVLAVIGIGSALNGDDRVRRAVAHAAMLWILSAAALSAVSVLDYDWRYRLPLMPQLILLAAIGIEAVVRKLAPAGSRQPAVVR